MNIENEHIRIFNGNSIENPEIKSNKQLLRYKYGMQKRGIKGNNKQTTWCKAKRNKTKHLTTRKEEETCIVDGHYGFCQM